jgi:hypothetical protein
MPRPNSYPTLYGVFFVKGVPQGSYPFSSSVSLFDPKARFLVPTIAMDSRRRA